MSVVLLALLSVLIPAGALWLYLRRELPVRGRGALATARVGTLALLLLLLWNPRLPDPVSSAPSSTWLLLDVSGSMGASEPDDGPTPWGAALERAGAGSWERILVFGDAPRSTPADRLDGITPDAADSRVEPALRRAAEAGAGRVLIVSDGRLRDPSAARATALELGLDVSAEWIPGPRRSGGVSRFDLPSGVREGEELRADVALFARGSEPGDSLTLEVREEGRLVASRRLPAPASGRLVREMVDLPAPGDTGQVRYTATVVSPDDAFADDDTRVARLRVGPEQGGVVLVALRPDWEPRFLLPRLGRVSGLPTRGYLRVGADRFITVAGSDEPAGLADEAGVRRAVAGAEILIVQGLGTEAPEWLLEATRNARRLVAFPTTGAEAASLGAPAGSPLPGEWYPSGRLPASPLAGDLAGVPLTSLPPLSGVLPLVGTLSGDVPLTLQRRGSGPEEAAAILISSDASSGSGPHRRVLMLARGFWQWAFRDGAAREAYRRLWSGVVGWLLADEVPAVAARVAPRSHVVPRDRPISWDLADAEPRDSIAVEVVRGDSVVADTTLVPAGSSFQTPALAPGIYGYRVRASDGSLLGVGAFDVEAYSEEMLLDVADPESMRIEGRPTAAGSSERALRTSPIPYLLVLLLLCAEWIGRRRRGLR